MTSHRRPQHTDDECAALLRRFLLQPIELRARFDLDFDDHTTLRLLGDVLWDVFSCNHTVYDRRGEFDLGSWRGSAGFIADVMNEDCEYEQRFDYIDFYMGSGLLGAHNHRAMYEWVFTELRAAGCDWIYSFPRIYLLRFDAPDEPEDMLRYDPGEAVRAQLAQPNRDAGDDQLAAQVERAYEESVREARNRPLPATVAAYRSVYGRLPDGWPHPDAA